MLRKPLQVTSPLRRPMSPPSNIHGCSNIQQPTKGIRSRVGNPPDHIPRPIGIIGQSDARDYGLFGFGSLIGLSRRTQKGLDDSITVSSLFARVFGTFSCSNVKWAVFEGEYRPIEMHVVIDGLAQGVSRPRTLTVRMRRFARQAHLERSTFASLSKAGRAVVLEYLR